MAKEKETDAGVDFGEIVEPIGERVLISKDEDQQMTKGGIALPDSVKIPQITCRVLAISKTVENDPMIPIEQYDKVLVDPSNAIPVELDKDNRLFVLPVEDVVAVIRKGNDEN
jgi:chaperonin GroES